jgi:hypothetical protein
MTTKTVHTQSVTAAAFEAFALPAYKYFSAVSCHAYGRSAVNMQLRKCKQKGIGSSLCMICSLYTGVVVNGDPIFEAWLPRRSAVPEDEARCWY